MTEASGTEQLRRQLERMRESLRAFEDPIVEQTPGLRLMHETLQERERHIAAQIRKSETASVTLKVRGEGLSEQGASTRLIAAVLTALADAAAVAGAAAVADWDVVPKSEQIAAAVEPHLGSVEVGDELTLLITRPPGDLATQLMDTAAGAPLGEVALRAVVQALADGSGAGGGTGAAGVRKPLLGLADLLLSRPLTMTLEFSGYALDPLEVTLDRGGAQRFLAAAS